nr:phospholipid carrier-dependent glycosyltransferase [Nanchangia anserum]
MSREGAFVVHPQLGKWLLGIGPELFGWTHPWAWRLMPAIAGIVMVALICVLARQLFDSPIVTAMCGIFLALDGVAVSVSRIGLLDVFVAVFLLAGCVSFVRDQFSWHERLSRHLRASAGASSTRETFSLWRPWLVLTGILWGLALGVKWNALYVIAAGGIFLFIREVTARRAGSLSFLTALRRGVTRGGIPAFVQLVPTAVVVYLVTWTSWFIHPRAYDHGASGASRLLGLVRDFWIYQRDTLKFHEGVTSPHRYQANAAQWIFDLRPTSMMWSSQLRGNHEFVRASTTIGNPAMWWLGVAALAFVLIMAFSLRDWRAGFIVFGYVGTWVPWFIYWDRTIFMFYTVVLVPFVTLAVAYLIATFLGEVVPHAWPLIAWELRMRPPRVATSPRARLLAWALVILVIACGLFFLPVVAAWDIPRDHWQWRMWLPSWI